MFGLLGLLLLSLGLSAQTLQIIDTEGHSTTVTGVQIAKTQRVTVNGRDHDTPANCPHVKKVPGRKSSKLLPSMRSPTCPHWSR